jgi:hypothetical protein
MLFTVAPVVLYVEQNFSLLLGTEILPETAMNDINCTSRSVSSKSFNAERIE